MRSLCALVFLTACGKDPPPMCTTATIDLSCSTGYVPTFDALYVNTIQPRCGTDQGSCHARSGEAGLAFVDLDTTYAALRDGYVTSGDPTCSELIVRTIQSGTDYEMPPDATLPEKDRCALVKWVAAGAPGPGQPFPMMGASR
jgi:hypothetical protein